MLHFGKCYVIIQKLFKRVLGRLVSAGRLSIENCEVNDMKEGIQPKYYQAKVTCNCGNEFVTGSTKSEIHVEICSKCHTFYTGQKKAAQARGAIEKFNKKYGF